MNSPLDGSMFTGAQVSAANSLMEILWQRFIDKVRDEIASPLSAAPPHRVPSLAEALAAKTAEDFFKFASGYLQANVSQPCFGVLDGVEFQLGSTKTAFRMGQSFMPITGRG